MWAIQKSIEILAIVIPLLIAIAYVTLAERKILGSMQLRKGPTVVGIYGILQPLADGVKLFAKETILPTHANLGIYILAPLLAFTLSLISWAVIPYGDGLVVADINMGSLYLMAVSSISVYAIQMSGWGSTSKYAFIGPVRAAAQMISYEVSIGLIIISVILCAGELNLTGIVNSQKDVWYIFPLWPAFLMFFVSSLAETNRPPFDLTEGESELVSGYNVEYSAMTFALFFLGEYGHIILMSLMNALLFLGGWLAPFPFSYMPYFSLPPLPPAFWLGFKTAFFVFVFIWVRATFPRMRYDQLMQLLWKSYLPFSLAFVVFVSSILLSFQAL